MAEQFGDYVFLNASDNGITPVDGFNQYLASVGSETTVNYAEGCKLWSNDESGFDEAVAAAEASDVAIVMVGRNALQQMFPTAHYAPRLARGPSTRRTSGHRVQTQQQASTSTSPPLPSSALSSASPKPSTPPAFPPLSS